jgi:hypothetical protein
MIRTRNKQVIFVFAKVFETVTLIFANIFAKISVFRFAKKFCKNR